MSRKKITATLSSKALELLDSFAEGSGLGNRSRTIEEIIFTLNDLEGYLIGLREEILKYAKNEREALPFIKNFNNRVSATLDRFTRFTEIKTET